MATSRNAIYGKFQPTVKGTFFTRAHDIVGTKEYNRYHLGLSRKLAKRKARFGKSTLPASGVAAPSE